MKKMKEKVSYKNVQKEVQIKDTINMIEKFLDIEFAIERVDLLDVQDNIIKIDYEIYGIHTQYTYDVSQEIVKKFNPDYVSGYPESVEQFEWLIGSDEVNGYKVQYLKVLTIDHVKHEILMKNRLLIFK
ncbi:hypothetical protein SBRV1_gp05 [Sulfolobales Beppu rod-shaped virus 1]|uniref:Uncharacterized protein n=1 Tax=Sulfolobales Beppu rod-shaped virus 1 TaxID=2493121 RepID=A0A3S8NF66_9VIRU|nr:hypothetical protein QIT32_gp05 [Sulfolobales Beppu rod-shaped virus 1]AZI75894.1 hypothetical protein SBRV1_gp05 [Sulfolobales Beppu rod-shaped virus 1]